MKIKLLKKIRKQYPIYCLKETDTETNALLSRLFDMWGIVYFTGNSTFDIIANKTKDGLLDDIMYKVRLDWTVKIKGRTQKITKL